MHHSHLPEHRIFVRFYSGQRFAWSIYYVCESTIDGVRLLLGPKLYGCECDCCILRPPALPRHNCWLILLSMFACFRIENAQRLRTSRRSAFWKACLSQQHVQSASRASNKGKHRHNTAIFPEIKLHSPDVAQTESDNCAYWKLVECRRRLPTTTNERTNVELSWSIVRFCSAVQLPSVFTHKWTVWLAIFMII